MKYNIHEVIIMIKLTDPPRGGYYEDLPRGGHHVPRGGSPDLGNKLGG